jgi:ubiquinone biosynthesis protein Coq4
MQFVQATEGKSFDRILAAFRATPAGRELLQRQPDLGALFRDMTMLESCPAGSLGRWYAEFMTSHGLDVDAYLGAAIQQGARFSDDPEQSWFHSRVDACHDLRHVICGYQPDVLGEVCLCWLRFAQTRHRGLLVLAVMGVLNALTTKHRWVALRSLREAYQRGRRAQLLDLLPWEDQLRQPLAELRTALGLTPHTHYPVPFAPSAYASSGPAAS